MNFRIKLLIKLLILFLFMVLFVNARLLNFNQNADALDDKHESTFYFGHGVFFAGIDAHLGFMQRFGINDIFEIQLNQDISAFVGFSPLPINIYNYFDLGFKFNFFSGKNTEIAVIHYFGYMGGLNYYYPITGGYTGIKFIFSFYTKKKNSFYFGLNAQVAKNFFMTVFQYIPIEADANIIFGWELVHNNFVCRHEVKFGAFIYMLPFPLFSISYSFSFGGRYKYRE